MESTQQRLEDEALANGAYRFRHRLQELAKAGDSSADGAARKLLLRILEQTIEGLDAVVACSDQRPWYQLTRWLKIVGTDVAAYMTLKVLLGNHQQPQNLLYMAPTIAKLIFDETRYRKLQKEAVQLFNYRLDSFTTSSRQHKAYSLNQTARYAGVEDEAMDKREAMKIGMKLINVCIANTSIGSLKNEARKKMGKWQKKKLFVLSNRVKDLLEKTDDILQFTRPQALPMVIPPLDWSTELNGGYHYGLRGKYGLVRKSTGMRARRADMPFVYEGLNTIQAVAWRVNEEILRVVLDLRSTGSRLGGLPDPEPNPLPERPDWMLRRLPKNQHTEEQQAELREWKKRAAAIKEANNLRASKLIEWLTAISIAKQFSEFPAIWFPHSLDFRGRTYPICSGLQPQGSDLQRGLLTFANSKPLGADGAFWLAVHGANTLGEYDGIKFSKQSFDQRVQWIRANSKRICEAASDPEQFDWWSDADEPFQFLAFCIEWRKYMDCADDGERVAFRSSLPIGQDGTCNGLQHFAALLRDSKGARAVNLQPEPVPRDVYDEIHKAVRAALAKDAASGVAEGKWWLESGHLTRSLFKRPTMTFAYGSKTFGMSRQLQESLLNEDIPPDYFHYLAKKIWAALELSVISAFNAMKWLADCASALAPVAKVVEWTVPITGFPVRQEYWNTKRSMVKTVIDGSAIRLSLYEDTKTPMLSKHKNAIAPNFIHSLDAAALMMTVVRASTEGVEAFGMVHDCYSTHACDVPLLASATREAFIALYDGVDVVDQLHKEFSLVAPVPTPPPKGDLDIQVVRDSRYFFS